MGEGHYLATLINRTEELDRNNSYFIKKELASFVKLRREITVDLNGVKYVNKGGYKILRELLNKAYTKKCKIKFINAESSVSNKLLNLTEKILNLQKKSEIDIK